MRKILGLCLILGMGSWGAAGAQEKVILGLDPSELSLEKDGQTYVYSPDSMVMKAEYTYYRFAKPELLKALGGTLPTKKTWMEIEIKSLARSTMKVDPNLPQPEGGFGKNYFAAKVLRVLTPAQELVDLRSLSPGPNREDLLFTLDSRVKKASYDVLVFKASELDNFGIRTPENQEVMIQYVILATQEKLETPGKGSVPQGGFQMKYHRVKILDWSYVD